MSQMLLKYFKLDVQPFGVTPDPDFLFLSPTHREAMASLIHGILSGRGFTALVAQPGMGKTTLLFNLLHMLKGVAKTAFLFQTLCEPKEFLRALLADLGIKDAGGDFTEMHGKLNECLVRESMQGREVVVVIDEAQNLDERVLEVVRMLSNFETSRKKLMHVVLAGQPQLARKLASQGLTQLRQRISIVARLTPFNADETRAYIEHRLKLAGFRSSKPLFTDEAYAMIAEYSCGIPRNINNLCFNAMSLGCAGKHQTLDRLTIQEVTDDLGLGKVLGPSTTSESKILQEARRRFLRSAQIGLPARTRRTRLALAGPALRSLIGWADRQLAKIANTESLLRVREPNAITRVSPGCPENS